MEGSEDERATLVKGHPEAAAKVKRMSDRRASSKASSTPKTDQTPTGSFQSSPSSTEDFVAPTAALARSETEVKTALETVQAKHEEFCQAVQRARALREAAEAKVTAVEKLSGHAYPRSPAELAGRDIPHLLNPSVWGTQAEDPDWHYHYKTGIYLERVSGKLFSRDEDGKEWKEVGDILEELIQGSMDHLWDSSTTPKKMDQRLTPKKMDQGLASASQATEMVQEYDDAHGYSRDEWCPAPEVIFAYLL